MAQLQKNRWESKPQAEQRIQGEQLEDQLMNQFIADLESKDWGVGNDAEYNNLSYTEQEQYDLKMFQFFSEELNAKQELNPSYVGIEFENYLKIARPEPSFQEALFSSEADEMSKTWRDVYGSNSNLMKTSALKGRMAAIAGAQGQENLKS
jgi:hypothetical protein